jgi:hypothetical protein
LRGILSFPHFKWGYCECIGAFEVPDWESIPEFDILVEPRKGVSMYYSPMAKAV